MGNEKIYIYNTVGSSKVLINDPERSVEYATGLRYSSKWPKGFDACSFTVPRDVARHWAVKEAQQVIIRDGQKIVWQGRLELRGEHFDSEKESIEIKCTGWYGILAQRRIRRRWIDRTPQRFRIRDPNGPGSNNFSFAYGDSSLTWTYAAGADRFMANDDYHALEYIMPAGEGVTRIEVVYTLTNDGEGLELILRNVDTATNFSIANVTATTSGTYTKDFATPPNKIQLQAVAKGADYDTLDSVYVDAFLIRGFGTVAITAEDVIEDVLAELAAEISSDYDQIADPALTLDPFTTLNDGYETGDSIIQRAYGYSDSNQRVWGLCVWDETGTSDAKARAVGEFRDITDYDYVLSLADCKSYKLEPAMDEVKNKLYMRYTENGQLKYRTPTETALLQDQTSIDAYGWRDEEIDIGESTLTTADSYGKRRLGYTKEPLNQAHFETGTIRTKAGMPVSPGRVRGGARVKLLDTGETYFLRQTDYVTETGMATLYPDLPPNLLDIQLIQRTLFNG